MYDGPSLTAIGTRLGPYELVRELGHGGMASVYEARHVRLDKRVAIKVLHPHVAKNATAMARFAREGRAAARVHHDGVVEVHDVVLDTGRPYLVLELIEGPTLAEILASAPLPVGRAVDLVLPICRAVAHAHDAGVIHRDLKPSNVLIAREGGREVPKVTDFGISKLIDHVDEKVLTTGDGVLGTLCYVAPEQLKNPESVDDAADQYALGVILYEAITGRLPFEGSTSWALMQAVLRGGAAPPSRHVELPRPLEEAIMRALARDPGRRFASVADFENALRPFASLDGAPNTEASVASPVVRARPSARARAKWTAPLAIGAIGVAAVFVFARASGEATGGVPVGSVVAAEAATAPSTFVVEPSVTAPSEDPPAPRATVTITSAPITSAPITSAPITSAPITSAPITSATVANAAAPRGTRAIDRPRSVASATRPAESVVAPAVPRVEIGDNGAPIVE
jgi:serine/threonine-protein kinase